MREVRVLADFRSMRFYSPTSLYKSVPQADIEAGEQAMLPLAARA